MKSQVLHTVWCHISCKAAGEFWHWSLLGVKGLMSKEQYYVLLFLAFPPAHPPATQMTASRCLPSSSSSTLFCTCAQRTKQLETAQDFMALAEILTAQMSHIFITLTDKVWNIGLLFYRSIFSVCASEMMTKIPHYILYYCLRNPTLTIFIRIWIYST